MRLSRIAIFVLCAGLVSCDDSSDGDAATAAFVEAAKALFNDKEAVGGLKGLASAFMQSGAGKQVNDIVSGVDGNVAGPILSGIGNMLSGAGDDQSGASPVIGKVLENLMKNFDSGSGNQAKSQESGGGFDLETMLNMASMFAGDNGNAEGVLGALPMLLQNLGGSGGSGEESNSIKEHDHSGHSWYLPPILEKLHIMWEHFSNSELGQTIWKNSGLANIVGSMTSDDGTLDFEKIVNSFENPTLRRRWVKSLTNFVAEWISHISDPATRQRYLATAQYVGNGFLKSQGFPKSAMFDPAKPAESLSRIADAAAKRYLNTKIDSQQYIKPAVAYFQELLNLASEKGFIMSHINANELSTKLSNTVNNEFIDPLLKVYRAYKWGVKRTNCAAHILCVINEKEQGVTPTLRHGLTKMGSYVAAWFISTKTGANFWPLYEAISESERCFAKHPVDCTEFHEEEVRVTTEAIHSEL